MTIILENFKGHPWFHFTFHHIVYTRTCIDILLLLLLRKCLYDDVLLAKDFAEVARAARQI